MTTNRNDETPAVLPEMEVPRRWHTGLTTYGNSNHAVSVELLFGKSNTRAECGKEMRSVEPYGFDRGSEYACKRCKSIIAELLLTDAMRQFYAEAARQDAKDAKEKS